MQVHEFVLADVLTDELPKEAVESLQCIRSRFRTPEDINDDRAAAPSKRIMQEVPDYDKRMNGPQVARAIGLDAIRDACPRFGRWLTWESLGGDG